MSKVNIQVEKKATIIATKRNKIFDEKFGRVIPLRRIVQKMKDSS